MKKSMLAIGAHADDCVFGVGATLLMAVERGYDVHCLSLTRNVSTGMEAALRELCAGFQIAFRCLDYQSQALEITPESKRTVAGAVAAVEPETVFLIWPQDLHHDHEVAGKLGMIPLRQGHRLHPGPFAIPRKIFHYDMGPGHSIGFTPTVYVDVTSVWERYRDLLRRTCETLRHPGLEGKEIMALYRGLEANRGFEDSAKYAEAFRAADIYVQDVL